MLDVLRAIRDGVATLIDAVVVSHEQRECVDLDSVVDLTYYPALAIQLECGEWLDLIVYDGRVAVTTCVEVAGDFYLDDPGGAEFLLYEAPEFLEHLTSLLAADGVDLTVASVAA